MANQLLIRPFAWSSVNPSAAALRANPSLFPSIQIFGYTSDDRTIYIRIPRKSTFILRFTQEIDNEMITSITDILNPSSVKPSYVDSRVLIVRAPELSPIELTANPNNEGLATWIEAKQDPYGEIEALWEARELGPYEWISVSRYSPIPGKYTNADLNIRTEEDYLLAVPDTKDLPYVMPRLIFWDIETFASRPGQFPNASNPNDFISLISVITASSEGTNGYVIVKGNVNPDLIPRRGQNMVLVRANDEKDLLNKFFAIYNTFKPDRQVYYNGDTFDMPYFLDRLNINGMDLPRISKIPSLAPYVKSQMVPTPFGHELASTMVIPGTEIIDLIQFFRRFYPQFKNHKLDYVSKFFLGEGKTGLTIDAMMDAIRRNDPVKMAEVVDYSFTDSLRMIELWDLLDIQDILESLCNNLGISISTLLRADFDDIVDRVAYNVDAGFVTMKGKPDSPTHLKEAVRGFYRNVYIYDYSELYRQVMLLSEQPLVQTLATRIEGAPPKLIMTAFYSSYVDRTQLLPILNKMLLDVLGTNLIIAIEPFIIRSIGPLDAEWLKDLGQSLWYVSVSKASYITLDQNGEIELAGLSKLCRPKFELAADIIRQYLTRVYEGTIKEFVIPDLQTLPLDKFILSEKLGTSEKPDTVKSQLTTQYGSQIVTWVVVGYVQTTRGPVLQSALKAEDTLDYAYYMTELGKYLKELQSLKIYGV